MDTVDVRAGEDSADSKKSKTDEEGVWYIVCVVVIVPTVPPRKTVDRLRERDAERKLRLGRRAVMSMDFVGGVPRVAMGVGMSSSMSASGIHSTFRAGNMGGESGGTSSSMRRRASNSDTLGVSRARSILFPTTMQQKSWRSSSSTGAFSRKSAHHRSSACNVSG